MPWQNTIINQLIIQGTNANILIYNGTPGLGTLVGSWSAVATTDAFGNVVPLGLNAGNAYFTNATIIAGLISNALITTSQLNQSSLYESTVTFDSGGGNLLMYASTTTTVTLAAGTATWSSPVGVTVADIKCTGSAGSGAGGKFNQYGGEGGGGGEYAEYPNYTLTPSTVYHLSIAAGGTARTQNQGGINGGSAVFDTTNISGPGVTAHGGFGGAIPTSHVGGAGGTGSNAPIHYPGGNGGNVPTNGNHSAAGGGGAATAAGPGTNGSQFGTGGIVGGGAGGGTNINGVAGGLPGGGGGGAGFCNSGSTTSGTGGAGRIVVTYSTSSALVGAISPVAGTDAASNAYAIGFNGVSQAFTPGSSPVTPEVWHSLPLTNSWTVRTGGYSAQYRMSADNMIEVVGEVSHASTSGTSQLATALPNAYFPANNQDIICFANASGGFVGTLALSTAGILSFFNLPTGTTIMAFSGRFPKNGAGGN